jgi:hypothetical protein
MTATPHQNDVEQTETAEAASEGDEFADSAAQVRAWAGPQVQARHMTSYEVQRPEPLGTKRTRAYLRTSALDKWGQRKFLLEVFKMIEDKATIYHDIETLKQDLEGLIAGSSKWAGVVREVSILVRKLLRRGNFRSVEDLRNQVLSFIAYFNRTMAKPFKWT